MRILYLDCGMGAAGDMLQGALVSLLSREEQESFINEINNTGLDVNVTLRDDVKCGITGKHISVHINGEEEHSHDVHEHQHEHEHHHGDEHHGEHKHHYDDEHHHENEHQHDHHHHEHHHASMNDIKEVVSKLQVSEQVKKAVISIYEIVAAAESKVHGKDVTEVHFHEVGMKDAIADITGVAMLIEKLSIDRIVCSPINTGFGKVKCAHGILPVPAPATAEILNGIPAYAGMFEGEMCTPTGAAIIKYYVDTFSNMPLMISEKSGYGTGNKEFPAANVVKAVLGTTCEQDNDQIIELKCNVDDMTGEELSYAIEKLLEAGARDAFVTPVYMKKGRSGHLITVICTEDTKDKIVNIIFKYTSTIGIRECVMNRSVLSREIKNISTEYGEVRLKVSEGYGVKKSKIEYDDIKRIADETGEDVFAIRKKIMSKIREMD